ncbi:MAG: hypothetical protein A3F68_13125 [Acidobacteria bacterium RIFCSPLOWO2_12_FULL_54_10]|nr:MAG: hypothetical protein A3F68_13125 [Acidobacteria bacterium RIFCSPLOWO2_12_FULL_54_10]
MTHTIPIAYLITFTCYGARLHGDEAGSVDREHNFFNTPSLSPNSKRVSGNRKQMKQTLYELDGQCRIVVLETLQKVCSHRGWTLLAAHVRSTHVHFIVVAKEAPEKILNDIKAYASRALNRIDVSLQNRRRWTRHGSTRYLWNSEQLGNAIHYVVREQGAPMAVWENINFMR